MNFSMKSPLISIIIPSYNVEEYISRCLDSVYDQDIDEDKYEVMRFLNLHTHFRINAEKNGNKKIKK